MISGRPVTVREWFREMRRAFDESLDDALREERYFDGSRADVVRARSYLRTLEVAIEILRVDANHPTLPRVLGAVIALAPKP